MAYCKRCGTHLSNDANFCPKCGEQVGISKDTSQSTFQGEQYNEELGWGLKLSLAILSFLAFIGIVGGISIGNYFASVLSIFAMVSIICIFTGKIRKKFAWLTTVCTFTVLCFAFATNGTSEKKDEHVVQLAEPREKDEDVNKEKNTIESPNVESDTYQNDSFNWLQGHWMYEEGDYMAHYEISGNTITSYSSMYPSPETATFTIEGDELIANTRIMATIAKLDLTNHTIDWGGGRWMHKVSSSSNQ